ncbi:MAG TPA: hypothetical protein VF261_02995 [Candidatus Saccharimonadales bacterium]
MKEPFSLHRPPDEMMRDPTTAVLIGNSISTDHFHDLGETTDQIAQAEGVLTVAFDRGSGAPLPFVNTRLKQELSRGDIRAALKYASKLDNVLDANGIETSIASGQSGGAYAAFVLGMTEGVRSLKLVHGSEMPALTPVLTDPLKFFQSQLKLQGTTVAAAYPGMPGKWPWTEEQLVTSTEPSLILPFDDHRDLALWPSLQRAVSIARLFLREKRYYQGAWSRGNMIDEIEKNVATRHVFPFHLDIANVSMVLPADTPEHEEASRAAAARLDEIAAESDGWFTWKRRPDTQHQSFDNRPYFLSCLYDAAKQRHIELPVPDYDAAYPLLAGAPAWFSKQLLSAA